MMSDYTPLALTKFTDFDGRPLAVGDRIYPLGWGYGVRLVNASSWATVVGFGRSRIRVQFDGWVYGGTFPDYDVVGKDRTIYARKAEHYSCEHCGDPLGQPTGAGSRSSCAADHRAIRPANH